MAVATLGTAATSTLNAVPFSPSQQQLLPADLALIANAILNDQNVASIPYPGAFSYAGLLYVPNRGWLRVLPGDFVAVDRVSGVGWPILISAEAAASAAWVHVP